MSKLKKWIIRLVAFSLLLLAASMFGDWGIRRTPGVLAIHCNASEWRAIDIESPIEPHRFTFNVPAQVVKVAPPGHGVYLMRIGFVDGREVWATYFHSDAGHRRRVDVYADHKRGSDTVHFRCILNADSHTVFDGDVEASKTSHDHPLVLLWI